MNDVKSHWGEKKQTLQSPAGLPGHLPGRHKPLRVEESCYRELLNNRVNKLFTALNINAEYEEVTRPTPETSPALARQKHGAEERRRKQNLI